jgi:hypothetical protein
MLGNGRLRSPVFLCARFGLSTQREPYLNKRCKEIRRAFTGSSRSEALTIASFSHAHVSFLLVLEQSEHAKVATAFERDDPFFGHLRWH